MQKSNEKGFYMMKDLFGINKKYIYDNEGKETELDIFLRITIEKTGKHYIVYTDDSKDLEGCLNIFMSVLEDDGTLSEISSDAEWELVESLVEKYKKFLLNKDSLYTRESEDMLDLDLDESIENYIPVS